MSDQLCVHARLLVLAATPALLLSACDGGAEETTVETPAQIAAGAGQGDSAEPGPEPAVSAAPDEYDGTAWRVETMDGARFATYFDAGGTYRELRNGDPYQTGTWRREGEQLCLDPDLEGAAGGCWEPGRMRDEQLIMTSVADGRRIELDRIDYVPPAPDDEEDGEGAEQTSSAD